MIRRWVRSQTFAIHSRAVMKSLTGRAPMVFSRRYRSSTSTVAQVAGELNVAGYHPFRRICRYQRTPLPVLHRQNRQFTMWTLVVSMTVMG